MSETTQTQENKELFDLPPGVPEGMRNVYLLQAIAQEMKEIPVLASEVATDSNPLVKVEFPAEGGILTYMGAHELPYRGFPFHEFVDKIDLIKKLSRGMVSGLFHALKSKRWLAPLALPLVFIAKDLLYANLFTFHRLIDRFRVKRERYSRAVRELYRVFDNPRANEDLRTLEIRLMLKDIVCMLAEFDNAYRFRLQDVLPELNKEALKKNPIKEINRLLDIMSVRENSQEVRDTWRLGKMVVKYYLRFDRKLLSMVTDILANLDLEQIKMTPEDVHYSKQRKDYTFRFMQN